MIPLEYYNPKPAVVPRKKPRAAVDLGPFVRLVKFVLVVAFVLLLLWALFLPSPDRFVPPEFYPPR